MATSVTAGAERVVMCHDDAVGLAGVIVVDDTTLGPALGGIRMRPFPSEDAAVSECRRLARMMTLKSALADVAFGGGKGLILDPGGGVDRVALMRSFGQFVARTSVYVPATDMGTTLEDLRVVASAAPEIRIDDVDTAPATAVGTHAAIVSAVRAAGVSAGVDGLTVAVQGVGHVGARLARLLAADGARVLVADADHARAAAVARGVSGRAVPAGAIVGAPCDVLAPCAVARVVNHESVGTIRAKVIAGAANDVLAEPSLADRLAERGIVYVPDFLASAGGVVQVRASHDEWSAERLRAALRAIGERAEDVIGDARANGDTTVAVAERAAYSRIRAASRSDPGSVS
jgi:leucine dehydrogenase